MQELIAILAALFRSPQRDAEDIAMIQKIKQNQESALSELYDRYGQLLYSFVMRMLRSVEDAEDIVQDVFLQVWNKADSYEQTKGTVYTWLVTMTRNRAIDRLRSKGYKKHSREIDINSLIMVADEVPSNPHTKTVANESQQMVAGALKQLSVDQQQVLALAYYEGYSQSEIAAKLNVPLGTVKSRMRKGLMTMRSWLQEKM
ncbi:MAG: sigma-70 family RNA polymerase sigma factor [Ignavibacteriales bacterium]|nr:sigma-70 family RNA polymerase sigma factor [Ignavibacteriales bacterium]